MKALLISCVMIKFIWPMVKDMLHEAARLFDGYTLEDIHHDLTIADSMLWVAVDDKGIIHGAMVVRIIDYPRKRTCHIRLIGGRNMEAWMPLWDEFEDWVRALNCKDIEFVGRHGWSKLLLDFESPARLYRKKL